MAGRSWSEAQVMAGMVDLKLEDVVALVAEEARNRGRGDLADRLIFLVYGRPSGGPSSIQAPASKQIELFGEGKVINAKNENHL